MTMFFTLSSNTEIQSAGEIDEPTLNAIAILKRDMAKIFVKTKTPKNRILVSIADHPMPAENWTMEISPNEILIHAADSLGCVYALLYISENFLGVTPFWFWNDQRFYKCAEKKVAPGTIQSKEFAVRYRGWFVNDEVLIDNWPCESDEKWRMVFETLLRCGGNITIPGTDGNSKKNRALAAGMGLWLTHHHAEPLGAQMFSRVYPDKKPSYTENSYFFEKLWEQAVIDQKEYNVIWNLGFRGQGDRPFWVDDPQFTTAEQRGKLISGIVKKQLEIVKRHIKNPVCCINIYGENAELYRNGNLEIPPDIIKIWADNGYGCMVSRRQNNNNPRIHSLPAANNGGKHGIYYHCSFHDLQASNHLTMSPNSMEYLTSELEKSLAASANECWIVNSGSVKPHVHTLDLLREIWRTGKTGVSEWRKNYVTAYYGEERQEEISALFDEYSSCTAKFGSNEDERAGEQIWHHPVRELLCRWMSGDTEKCLESLLWLTKEAPFLEQVKTLREISVKALPKWDAFCRKCESLLSVLKEDCKKLFCDSLYLQSRLHLHGAAGAKYFCDSFAAFDCGNIALSFKLANQSLFHYEESVKALLDSEHDKWIGYYNGDCLTDLRLTASCLNALVSYLRVVGDGPDFHKWERDFLNSTEDRNVMLLSSKQRALTNEELARCLFK